MACSALNMYWKCSVVLCQTVLPADASTGSPTGSPRSLPKRAKSPHPENVPRLAEMQICAAVVINGRDKKMHDAASNAELLEALDQNGAAGREALASASDDHLAATMLALNMTRVDVLRERMMSHMIHHRGQLTV